MLSGDEAKAGREQILGQPGVGYHMLDRPPGFDDRSDHGFDELGDVLCLLAAYVTNGP